MPVQKVEKDKEKEEWRWLRNDRRECQTVWNNCHDKRALTHLRACSGRVKKGKKWRCIRTLTQMRPDTFARWLTPTVTSSHLTHTRTSHTWLCVSVYVPVHVSVYVCIRAHLFELSLPSVANVDRYMVLVHTHAHTCMFVSPPRFSSLSSFSLQFKFDSLLLTAVVVVFCRPEYAISSSEDEEEDLVATEPVGRGISVAGPVSFLLKWKKKSY